VDIPSGGSLPGVITAEFLSLNAGRIVLSGSQAVLAHRPSATNSRRNREKLIKNGTLTKNGDHYVFAMDVEFGSPSTAGSIVRGGGTNGLTNWKNKSGLTLKQLEAELT